jgi:hypothetical protein
MSARVRGSLCGCPVENHLTKDTTLLDEREKKKEKRGFAGIGSLFLFFSSDKPTTND